MDKAAGVVELPLHIRCTATVDDSGDFTYTPTGTFTGTDTFTVEGCDDGTPSLCDTGTVTVTVSPLAVDDAARPRSARRSRWMSRPTTSATSSR